MNWNKPNYYITVDEFANLVTEAVYECGYFKREDLNHPEDIEAAFTSTAVAVAKGATFVINRMGSKVDKNNWIIENTEGEQT